MKKRKMDDFFLHPEERAALFTLLEDENIQLFLISDSCLKISDKYLLAMVLTYFRRAGLPTEEYRKYFFPSLFLANQFEEDEPFREEIYPWAFGWTWTIQREQFHQLRNLLFIRMGFRAWVDRATCDLIMAQDPGHWAWKRERKVHHSWAIRQFRRKDTEFTIKGPWISPEPCSLCPEHGCWTYKEKKIERTGWMKTWIPYHRIIHSHALTKTHINAHT
ncbi:speedy protein 1-A-like [Bufo bufo]|uniref:speedy protein 1-A-like n=1 Tax=Bufo bufo TaxID=8384 RepID=UPI001ABE4AB5|nr:speedy protein 1-A-like [Bufo bufo]